MTQDGIRKRGRKKEGGWIEKEENVEEECRTEERWKSRRGWNEEEVEGGW